jgi:acyl phosphate:glycerol-3-phosphate acyltransferase
MTPWLLLAASYLLGAVPSSYLVGRLARGIDLRQHGSGNLGATNTFRVLGWRLSLPVLAYDIVKGWAPVALFPLLDGSTAWGWALAYGVAAVLGHVFSVFVRFRGGKGVATGAGVFLALAPPAAILALAVWGGLVWATRIVSVGSIAAALVIPPAVYLTQGPGPVLWLALGLALFVVVAHRANVARLVRGEERGFRRRGPGEPDVDAVNGEATP